MGGLVAGGLGGFRFVAHSRYRPGLAVWVVGCRGRRIDHSASLSLPPSIGPSPCKSLSSSVAIAISTRCSPHTARVPFARPCSCVTPPTLAVIYLRLQTRRPQLCPARRCCCDLQLARDLQLRPPHTHLDRGNPAYYTPRGITRPLAASTNPHERLPRGEECASALPKPCARVDAADWTPAARYAGTPLRKHQYERSSRPDVVAGTREHGHHGDHERQPRGSFQHLQH